MWPNYSSYNDLWESLQWSFFYTKILSAKCAMEDKWKKPRFWNIDWTVQFDWKNLELLIFAVLLVSRIAPWKKSRDPCKPRLDLTVLRTVNGSRSSHRYLLKKKKIKALNGTIPEYLLFLVGKNISTVKNLNKSKKKSENIWSDPENIWSLFQSLCFILKKRLT